MSLFARMAPGRDPATAIKVHRFAAALTEWATGGLTKAQIIAAFNLDAGEDIELTALQNTYSAIPSNNAFNRSEFLTRMHNVFVLVETGDYTEAKAKTRLGF